jgi:hypothetical protein
LMMVAKHHHQTIFWVDLKTLISFICSYFAIILSFTSVFKDTSCLIMFSHVEQHIHLTVLSLPPQCYKDKMIICVSLCNFLHNNSSTELYRLSNRNLSVKLVSTFADRGFFQIAPQMYSRSWVDPVPDPLLLRKSGTVGNRIRISGSVARNSDH